MKIPRFVILEFSKLNAIPLNLCVFNDIKERYHKGQWIYHDMTHDIIQIYSHLKKEVKEIKITKLKFIP